MNAARHTALTDEPTPSEVTAEAFKAAFRVHPAGVALVSAATATGPVGLTASSVASVAADPPVLSFSVTRATGSAGALLGADSFVVHLLADHQVDLARAFARSGAPRFTPEQGWSRLPTGEPVLPEARAALRCRALQLVPVGSSTLVLAEVLEVHGGSDAPPLVYHDRRFHRLDHEASEL
ncbi:flavin reductase family protein [Agromyces sp. H3Y2-19a]|uniref:flavin reductase family protein n=1 Tax=Agromyces TaxID=33877 RepID=UPI001E3C49AE|nr:MULTISPECIES: flavin reductase family protein [Agromyces]MCD5347401.1 flavin reductase family protein [Agromyces sp. S2-1-8]MDF0513444.1 flavin reductase family protein [Agromyces chromiiresistens]